MKKQRGGILIVLALAMVLALSTVLVACNDPTTPKKTIVYLGDSIAEALIGPSPISERDNYGYYALVGKANDYVYYNHSVSGHKTSDGMTGNGMKGMFYDFDNDEWEYKLRTEDKDANMFTTHVKQADIIHISILGNNALQYDLGWLMIEQAHIEEGDDIIGDNAYYKTNPNFIIDTDNGRQNWYDTIESAEEEELTDNDITKLMIKGNPALSENSAPVGNLRKSPLRPSLELDSSGNGYVIGQNKNVEFDFPNTEKDIDDIVKAIKTLNPTAKIIFQKVYNPVFEGTTLLPKAARLYLNDLNNKYEDIANVRALAQNLLNKLNGVLDTYLASHQGAFEILDVTKAFDDVAKSDKDESGKINYGADSKGAQLIFNDWTHPSNKGHAVIAAATQAKLEEMKLSASDATSRYKAIRLEQIDRMYAELDGFDANAAKAAINAATSYQAVSDAYFAAIDDAGTPNYALNGKINNFVAFNKNTVFEIDNSNVSIMGNDLIYTFVAQLLLDDEQCYFSFGTDGKMHAQLQTNAGVFADIQGLLNDLKDSGFDLGDFDLAAIIESIDLGPAVENMVAPMFPGFTLSDLKGSLELIKNSLGFNITGLDYDNENIKQILSYVAQNEKLPGNIFELLPSDMALALTFDHNYTIKTVYGANGKKMQCIYIGGDVANNAATQPFAVMTMGKEDNKTVLDLRIEFMDVSIRLVEKTA